MGNSVNRVSSAHIYENIFSTHSKLPGKLSLLHLKSPLQFLHGERLCRPLYTVRFHSGENKNIQGHQTKGVWISENFVDFRRYCSGNQLYSEGYRVAKEDCKMDVMDVAIPNKAWSSETCELYKSLRQELIQQTDGDWCEHESNIYCGEKRLFTKAVVTELPGKFFEYRFFFSQKKKSLKGVIQFGPYTQGPPGCVHGGASASMMDSAFGVCINRLYSHCVTANLSINYKRLLPLGAATLVESWIDKDEGRKVFASAELKSPDGNVTYVTATAIFIKLDLGDKTKDVKEKMDQLYKR